MELISIIGVVTASLAVVWLLDRVSRRRSRGDKPDVKLRQANYSAGDWFDDAKSYRRPPPGSGGGGLGI